MQKYFLGLALVGFFFMATPAKAAALTEPQIQAILNLLMAFGVNYQTVKNVDSILHPLTVQITLPPMATSTATTTSKFTAPLKTACRAQFFTALDTAHKEVCMDWWVKEAPFNADGGTNMPQVWYDYYLSKNR